MKIKKIYFVFLLALVGCTAQRQPFIIQKPTYPQINKTAFIEELFVNQSNQDLMMKYDLFYIGQKYLSALGSLCRIYQKNILDDQKIICDDHSPSSVNQFKVFQ